MLAVDKNRAAAAPARARASARPHPRRTVSPHAELVQNLKKRALELMQKELQFFVERCESPRPPARRPRPALSVARLLLSCADTNLATQASIVAGFAFDGLVEMEVPEECGTTPLLHRKYHDDGSGVEDTEGEQYGALFQWRVRSPPLTTATPVALVDSSEAATSLTRGGSTAPQGGVCGVAAVYYIFDAAAMAFALYTVCVASFCTVYGHRLALQGPTGSVKKSVAVMKKQLQVTASM